MLSCSHLRNSMYQDLPAGNLLLCQDISRSSWCLWSQNWLKTYHILDWVGYDFDAFWWIFGSFDFRNCSCHGSLCVCWYDGNSSLRYQRYSEKLVTAALDIAELMSSYAFRFWRKSRSLRGADMASGAVNQTFTYSPTMNTHTSCMSLFS